MARSTVPMPNSLPPHLTPLLVAPEKRRDTIRNKAMEGIKSLFPILGTRHQIDIEDVTVHPMDFGSTAQKDALLGGTSLVEPIKGVIVLKDLQGNVVSKSHPTTLLHLPYYSDRHTFIVDGNEYSVGSQVRLKPGVYTRRRGNQELESSFNLVKKGGNFSLTMEPETGRLQMKMGGGNVDLYPVLRGLGVTHKDIADHWGHDLAAVNEQKYGKKTDAAIEKLYLKVTPDYRRPEGGTTPEARATAVKEWFNTAGMDPQVVKKTLGVEHATVQPSTLLKASQKLISIFKKAEDIDDRDSLEYKRLHSADDFIKERIQISGRDIKKKIVHKLNHGGTDPDIKAIVPAGLFTRSIKSFLTQSDIASIPTNFNPMEVLDVSQKITPLGEGGIGESRAIPYEARQVHHTHLGIIDPVRTTESENAGVDVRAALHTARDDAGNLYSPMTNTKTGKREFVSASVLATAVIAFPNQDLTGKKKVDVTVGGHLKSVDPKDVQYQVPAPYMMYSPATNMVPLMESMQGNRALMAAKMQTQALCLKERDVPWVQVASQVPGSSTMEEVFGHMAVPVSPIAGKVARIDKDFIYIRPHQKKHAADTYSYSHKHHKEKQDTDEIAPGISTLSKYPDGKDTGITESYRPWKWNPSSVAEAKDAAGKRVGYAVMTRRVPGAAPLSLGKAGDPDFLYPEMVWVDPEHRRSGVGSALYDLIEKDVGLKSVHAKHQSPDAAALWKKRDMVKTADALKLPEPPKMPEPLKAPKVIGAAPVLGIKHKDGSFGTTSLSAHTSLDKTLAQLRKTAESEKDARHAVERLEQRTTLHPSVIANLDNVAESLTADGLTDTDYHMALPFNQGTAIFKKVNDGQGPKLVLATILGPGMKPGHGEELPKTHYERMFKGAEEAFFKVAAEEEGLVKIPYMSNYPLGTKSFLDNKLEVKEGDEVTQGQRMGESNYTRKGVMALGKNLRTGLMAYHGLNSNDAVVISESAAKKLTSVHLYREKIDIDDLLIGKEKHRSQFGNQYTRAQYDNLDEDGCAKKGVTLHHGDIVFAVMSQSQLSAESQLLGRLHKSLVKPYRNATHTWEHDFPGVVEDVFKTGKSWAVTAKTEESMVIGDKLSGRHGNKGVVSTILPDDQMVQDAKGRPLDILYTSLGIISRINPSQTIEMAVAKAAEHDGKPIAAQQFSGKNNVEWARGLLKERGLSDKETVFDPRTGKNVKGIMVGPQYFFKLMKQTATNYSARGIDGYDVNEQPSKGGTDGAKGLGRMEFAGLIAHGARDLLKENSLLRSQKNDEFWKRTQLGLPPLPPKSSFAYDKFNAMLHGAGIKVDKTGSRITLGALTDENVSEMSAGQVQNPLFLRAKDLKPEEGGLFDAVLTGGPNGKKWTHIDLHEPVVNPVFEDAARRLLGMTGTKFRQTVAEKGARHIQKQLEAIDLDAKRSDLKSQTKTLRGAALDSAVKQIKYIDALKKQDLNAGEAFVLSKIPVIPPMMRPVVPSPRGDVLVNDANYLYRDLMLANDKLKSAKEVLQTPEAISRGRTHLHDATAALFGLAEPVSPQNASRGVKGFLTNIAGSGSPKHGFFQGKLIKRQLDLSGRSTIVPDTNLAMDEIGLPEDMLWTMFEPFVVGRLIRRGYPATQAKQMVADRAPAAKLELDLEAKERPVIYNRAPTLHRFNLIGAYPKAMPGKTIRIPATWSETQMNADFDGDQQLGAVIIYVTKADLGLDGLTPPPYILCKLGEDSMATLRAQLGLLNDDGSFFMCDLSEVPHLPEHRTQEHIDFHPVPAGVRVIAYDELEHRFVLAPVSGWSKHHDRVTEIVTLRSGAQIISDDDARAVYGYDPLTAEFVRRRPSEARGVFVPTARTMSFFNTTTQMTSVKCEGAGGYQDTKAEVQLTEKAGHVIGTVVGDGWCSGGKQVCLANVDDAVLETFRREIEDVFFNEPVPMYVTERAGGDYGVQVQSKKGTVSSVNLTTTLEPWVGHGARNKHLPPFFLTASKEFRLGLLAGLLDTDGSISISNGKSKPQWMISVCSTSIRLAYETVYLCKSLGVRAKITAGQTRLGLPAYTITLSTVDAQLLGRMPVVHEAKKKAFEQFFATAPFDTKLGSYPSSHIVPIPPALAQKLAALYPNASTGYVTYTRARKLHAVTRARLASTLEEFPSLRGDPEFTSWVSLVGNADVTWDEVLSYENTGVRETGYDLTVPGYETFMTVDGVILSNTMQIHTPITRAGIEDVKRMTIPNTLFADRDKNKLFVVPQMEAVAGIYKATSGTPSNAKVRHFKTHDDAMAAYRKGEIGINDQVTVGK